MQQVVPLSPQPLVTGAPAAGRWGAAFEPRCGLGVGNVQSVAADAAKGVELQRPSRATAATPCDPTPMAVVLMPNYWPHSHPGTRSRLGTRMRTARAANNGMK
jgi:hypothetical protein